MLTWLTPLDLYADGLDFNLFKMATNKNLRKLEKVRKSEQKGGSLKRRRQEELPPLRRAERAVDTSSLINSVDFEEHDDQDCERLVIEAGVKHNHSRKIQPHMQWI